MTTDSGSEKKQFIRAHELAEKILLELIEDEETARAVTLALCMALAAIMDQYKFNDEETVDKFLEMIRHDVKVAYEMAKKHDEVGKNV